MSVPQEDCPLVQSSHFWRVEFVQLIVSTETPPPFFTLEWWKDLAGKHPDEGSTRVKGSRVDEGIFEGKLLRLDANSDRVIWEVRPRETVGESGIVPTLDGPFRKIFESFVTLMCPWLENPCPPVTRLGFSAKLLQHVTSAEAAYGILTEYLRIVKLDSNPNDFLLQINKRKDGLDSVAGRPINRVGTWSKMHRAIWTGPGRSFAWSEDGYATLQLDMNTAPEKADVLPRASLPALFRELADDAALIAEKGYNP